MLGDSFYNSIRAYTTNSFDENWKPNSINENNSNKPFSNKPETLANNHI